MLSADLTRRAATLALMAALLVPTAGAAAQQPAGATVTAQNVAFAPKVITVPAGTTVTWVNQDPFEHTVTAQDGSFDSGLFGQGQSFSFTFPTPGTYAYYCKPHGTPDGSGMAGTVVVTAAPAGPGSPAGSGTSAAPAPGSAGGGAAAPAGAAAQATPAAGTPPAAARPGQAGLPLAEMGTLLLASGSIVGAAGLWRRRYERRSRPGGGPPAPR